MKTYTADEVDEMIGRALAREREQHKPLTDEQWQAIADTLGCFITRSQKEIIEATIGIKEKNT